MKELSIEEKAKAYDEAIKYGQYLINERCKEGTDGSFHRADLDKMFPELAESEDEKIRKAILKHFREYEPTCYFNGCFVKDILAWLEKRGEKKSNPVLDIEIPFGAKDSELQEASYYIPEGFHAEIEGNRVVIKRGEQKPAWSEDDEKFVHGLIRGLSAKRDIHGHTTFSSDGIDITKTINWLKSLKGRVQPQKQEWSERDDGMYNRIVSFIPQHLTAESYTACITWLKSLSPQNHWKPSDEQMEALSSTMGDSTSTHYSATLHNLYNDLKKLREG